MTILAFVFIIIILMDVCGGINTAYRRILALDIIVSSQIEVGYFIKIGRFNVDYSYVTQALLLVLGILYVRVKKVEINKFFSYVFFISIILINMVSLILFPYSEAIIGTTWDEYLIGGAGLTYAHFGINNLVEYIKLVFFSTNLLVFFMCYREIDISKCIFDICKAFKLLLIYGVIEAVVNNFFVMSLFNECTSFVTGKAGNELDIVYLRNGLNCLQGLTLEPSHYVYSLFFIYLILLLEKKITGEKNRVWFAITLALLLLCRSFSSVYVIIAIVVLEYVLELNNQYKSLFNKILLGFMLILGGILGSYVIFMRHTNNYVYYRFYSIISTLPYLFNGNWRQIGFLGSSQIRIISIIESLPIIMSRPLIGIGMGTAHLHSSILMSMVSIGGAGLFAWFLFVFGSEYRKHRDMFKLIMLVFIIMNIFGSNGAKILYSEANIIYLLFIKVYSNPDYGYFSFR